MKRLYSPFLLMLMMVSLNILSASDRPLCSNVTNPGTLNPWFNLNQPGPTYDPPNISATGASGGGGGGIQLQWQKKEGSGSWQDIPGATGNGYNSPVINTTTSFRRKARRCNNPWLFTNEITITLASSPPSSSLSVSSNSLSFGASSGNQSINVSANVSWTVSDNQGWISVSPASGSNNGAFSVSVSANNGTSSRSGQVTVSGGGITETISISQSGSTPSNSLSVSSNSLNVNASANSQNINVTSNVSWTVSDNQSWISVNPSSGSNNGAFSISVTANSGTNSRSGQVTVSGGGLSETISVSQNGSTPTGGTTSVTVKAKLSGACCANIEVQGMATTAYQQGSNTVLESQAISVPATSFTDYSVTLNGSFPLNRIRVAFTNDDNGSRDVVIKSVTVDGTTQFSSNADVYSVGALVNGSCAGGFKSQQRLACNGYFHYDAAGGNPPPPSNSSSLNTSSQSFGNSAASQSVNVTSNVNWTVSDDRNWISVSPATGANNGSFTVSVTANGGSSTRNGTVTVSGGGITRTVAVSQSGASSPPPGTNLAWQRFNQGMGKGFNASGWLEAWWFIKDRNSLPVGYTGNNDFPLPEYTEQDFADAKAAGFESVRLPVSFEHFGSNTAPYNLDFTHPVWVAVDDAIQWAANQDLTLIIDMHHAPKNPINLRLTNANFSSNIPRLKRVWEQLTLRYGNLDPNRYFFEIYNEPDNQISNANWRTVAQALIDQIRATEAANNFPSHTLIVGANDWNSIGDSPTSPKGLNAFAPFSDNNIIYTVHYYRPIQFTHQQFPWFNCPPFASFPPQGNTFVINTLNEIKRWIDDNNRPVMIGEFGVSQMANAQSRENWIELIMTKFNEAGVAWYYWGATGFDLSAVGSTSCTPGNDIDQRGFGFYTNGKFDPNSGLQYFLDAMDLVGSSSRKARGGLDDQIFQTQPNPFKDHLEIRINLPEKGRVEVQMLNAMGQQIQSVNFNRNLTVGEQAFNLRTDQLSSGIYFLRMQYDGKSLVRKLVKL
ncbi:MAG: cellulase family glycosylhydrolase [Bacteroidota bacterium]